VVRVCTPDAADERHLQISVELEISGNVWEMAFPPTDWFAFAESKSALTEVPAPSFSEHHDALPRPNPSAVTVELAADRPPAAMLEPNARWFESVLAADTERLQAALDAISQQIIARLRAQLERELSSCFDHFSRSVKAGATVRPIDQRNPASSSVMHLWEVCLKS
jgi:hypothetical protein